MDGLGDGENAEKADQGEVDLPSTSESIGDTSLLCDKLTYSAEETSEKNELDNSSGISEPPLQLSERMARIDANEAHVTFSNSRSENVDFKVTCNKIKHDVSFPLDATVSKLKMHLQGIIGIAPQMQKIMYKGLARDGLTLRDLGIVKGAKVMVVGSKLDDILSVSTPGRVEFADDKASGVSKEPICQQKQHRKVLDKGVPEDAMPGIKNTKDPLPPFPLSGMMNKSGGKVRLTFKLEQDQIWIGTKDRTDKIPMTSIKGVVTEPIEGHEEYHIMGIQLGPTEASRYWIYWVPAQYIDAVKDAILGKWQYF